MLCHEHAVGQDGAHDEHAEERGPGVKENHVGGRVGGSARPLRTIGPAFSRSDPASAGQAEGEARAVPPGGQAELRC